MDCTLPPTRVNPEVVPLGTIRASAPFVDGPASTCLRADPGPGPSFGGDSIGRLSGVGALWDCVLRVCGGGGGCAGGGVPLGAGLCCPDVGRCLSGVYNKPWLPALTQVN